MVLTATALFFLCNLGSFLLNLWEAFEPDLFNNNTEHAAFAYLILDLSNLTVLLNASSNFLVYLAFCQKYRQLFWSHPPISWLRACHFAKTRQGNLISLQQVNNSPRSGSYSQLTTASSHGAEVVGGKIRNTTVIRGKLSLGWTKCRRRMIRDSGDLRQTVLLAKHEKMSIHASRHSIITVWYIEIRVQKHMLYIWENVNFRCEILIVIIVVIKFNFILSFAKHSISHIWFQFQLQLWIFQPEKPANLSGKFCNLNSCH